MAIKRLDRETPSVRRKVFAALFPKLEDSVEAAWQFLDQLPYQGGYGRKAFRAPGRRQYFTSRADALLEGLTGGVGGFEQGTGVPINIVAPEQAASQLQSA